MRRLREKLTYANVMVTVLAFVVLGGSAYAATRRGLPAHRNRHPLDRRLTSASQRN
jgi:hypothetical protein